MGVFDILRKCEPQTLFLVLKTQSLSCSFLFKNFSASTRSYRTKRLITDSSFKVSYLQNTIGLSGKTLVRVSNAIHFESAERPDSVVQLLHSFGFSQTHIPIIIARLPVLLVYNAQICVKPKLDFLLSITKSKDEVVKLVVWDPSVLTRSLNDHLIPLFDLFVRLAGGHQNAAAAITDKSSFSGCALGNVELLWDLGVSYSQIVKMTKEKLNPLSRASDRFRDVVLKVKEFGFNPSSMAFRHAVCALGSVSELTWESKLQVYRSFGFSNEEILSMFKRLPRCMSLSVDKISKVLEFLLNKLCCCPSRVSHSPIILMYNFEKRVIPRSSVLQALGSRNRISSSLNLVTVVKMTDDKFLTCYVTPHKDQVPEVLDAYQEANSCTVEPTPLRHGHI